MTMLGRRSVMALLAWLALLGCRIEGADLGPERPECRMGTVGRQACGYFCLVGSDGMAVCSSSPSGACGYDPLGRAVCEPMAGGPSPECRHGSDGMATCGFNCRLGSGGSWFCATRPDGRCAMNSDGTWTCP